jgi:hypothetical protein
MFVLVSGREGGSVSRGWSCCGAPSEGSRRDALEEAVKRDSLSFHLKNERCQ